MQHTDPMYFKYTYETNGKTGPQARATLRAEHDFDPSTPEKHTVELELFVEEDGSVRQTPMIVEHEFE
jgi:hypothetical protein